MQNRMYLIAASLILLLAACANQSTHQGKHAQLYEPKASLSQFKTYGIEPHDIDAHRLEFENRVEKALKNILSDKGLTHEKKNPDLMVRYIFGAKKVHKAAPQPVTPFQGVYGHNSADSYILSSLAFEVTNQKTGEVVWIFASSDYFNPEWMTSSEITARINKMLLSPKKLM